MKKITVWTLRFLKEYQPINGIFYILVCQDIISEKCITQNTC